MNKQNVLAGVITVSITFIIASILRGSTDNLISRFIFLLVGAFVAYVIILIFQKNKKQ